MARAMLPGNPPVEITLRRSARARRVSLRVSGLDGKVTLSMPQRMKTAEALAFAEEKADWIRRHLAKQVDHIAPRIGATVMLRGQEIPIIAGAVRRAQLKDGALWVPAAPEMAASRVKAFLKLAARADLLAACERYAAALGRPYGQVTLRDTRSRWGSCSSSGNLMFSWRLIMAPVEVLDYVAAHEVAHLSEMNHSSAFWAEVERIYPDYGPPRQWLRENGQLLHRYRFDD